MSGQLPAATGIGAARKAYARPTLMSLNHRSVDGKMFHPTEQNIPTMTFMTNTTPIGPS